MLKMYNNYTNGILSLLMIKYVLIGTVTIAHLNVQYVPLFLFNVT